jgi:hypothetical protein
MGTKPRHPHKAGGAEVPRRAAHGPTAAFSSRPSMPQGTPRDAAASLPLHSLDPIRGSVRVYLSNLSVPSSDSGHGGMVASGRPTLVRRIYRSLMLPGTI